jgi:hypothetical protein
MAQAASGGISPRKPGLDPRPVHVRFVVDRVALGQVFHRVPWFSSVSIIPPVLHIHLHLHVALTRRTNGRSLGNLQKKYLFGNRRAENRKIIFSHQKGLYQIAGS